MGRCAHQDDHCTHRGYQTWLIIFGGLLIAWASFGLMT
jgi:hypothetical protein